MRNATLLLVALVAACSGRQTETPGPAPTPRPETVAEATGADNLPEVILPDSQLTDADRAAIRIERLEISVDPSVIREGETAALSLGAFDEAGERVQGASGQLFVVGQAAEITGSGDGVVGLGPGEARITVLIEIPASAAGPARTLREEALLEVLPARVTSLDITLPSTYLYAGARYLASSEARSEFGIRPDADVRWSSSNEAVVRVGAGGTMVAVAPGTSWIEAASEGVTTSAEVRVVANPIRRLRLDPLETNLRTGDVVHFSARALDAAGTEVSGCPDQLVRRPGRRQWPGGGDRRCAGYVRGRCPGTVPGDSQHRVRFRSSRSGGVAATSAPRRDPEGTRYGAARSGRDHRSMGIRGHGWP